MPKAWDHPPSLQAHTDVSDKGSSPGSPGAQLLPLRQVQGCSAL